MPIAEVAERGKRPVGELLRRLDAGELRGACMLNLAAADTWSWYDDALSHEPVDGQVPESREARLEWSLVRRVIADLVFVRIVLEPGALYQELNGGPVTRTVGVLQSRLLGTQHQTAQVARTVRAAVGVPIGLPSPLQLGDGRTVAGLWCRMYQEVALADLYIIAEDVPKALAGDARELTEAGRNGYLIRIGLLAKLIEANVDGFGSNEEPAAEAIAKAACGDGPYRWPTLRDDINAGLRLLAEAAGNPSARRKPGPKPAEEAKAGVVGKTAPLDRKRTRKRSG